MLLELLIAVGNLPIPTSMQGIIHQVWDFHPHRSIPQPLDAIANPWTTRAPHMVFRAQSVANVHGEEPIFRARRAVSG